jgi:hypothetical protein
MTSDTTTKLWHLPLYEHRNSCGIWLPCPAVWFDGGGRVPATTIERERLSGAGPAGP